MIDVKVAEFLERFLPAVARQERADVLGLGMVSTHVHLLVRLHPTTRIPHLIQKLKGGSATISTAEGFTHPNWPLRWAKGYSLSSVSERALPIVHEYVLNQPAHHPRERIEGWIPESKDLSPMLARAERNQRGSRREGDIGVT